MSWRRCQRTWSRWPWPPCLSHSCKGAWPLGTPFRRLLADYPAHRLPCCLTPPSSLHSHPHLRLLEAVAEAIATSPHLEFYLQWSLAVLQHHGEACRQAGSSLLGALRAVHKSIGSHRDALVKL
jgi:hypothetical protein